MLPTLPKLQAEKTGFNGKIMCKAFVAGEHESALTTPPGALVHRYMQLLY